MAGVISDQRTGHNIPHTVSCRALGVSESWFYKWRIRKPTGRELRRQQLTEEIKEIFKESGGTYGSPKIFILLVRKGWHVSVNTVARLMAELGLVARVVKHRKGLTRQGKRPAAPDHVKRDFTAEEPDLVWVGDMTEIVTSEGKIYLATVIDLFSRRLLGYAMGAHHDADLVVAALNMAGTTRGGDVRGVIFHSDRGSEGGFNRSSQHFDLGGVRRGHGGLEFEDQRCSGRPASAVAR
ncbi:IS3 family transposase [Streptomyces sp. H27-H5]|uniref:IS3 family transposase n=1 Tax=Streptomyces sp. H27-H5 TaxID=2996460 RepID=UPI00226E577B|nr:IS3 family transposase [Streptomyces sp. H27-H5]MCY0963479.1 IS3 family transposase [Streptomyces sp. H27-H5]